jgi:hypothetical protein
MHALFLIAVLGQASPQTAYDAPDAPAKNPPAFAELPAPRAAPGPAGPAPQAAPAPQAQTVKIQLQNEPIPLPPLPREIQLRLVLEQPAPPPPPPQTISLSIAPQVQAAAPAPQPIQYSITPQLAAPQLAAPAVQAALPTLQTVSYPGPILNFVGNIGEAMALAKRPRVITYLDVPRVQVQTVVQAPAVMATPQAYVPRKCLDWFRP